jgi:hypothetical protein
LYGKEGNHSNGHGIYPEKKFVRAMGQQFGDGHTAVDPKTQLEHTEGRFEVIRDGVVIAT